MNKDEIIAAIELLSKRSKSQSYYQRLHNQLAALPTEELDIVLSELENENFKDIVDLILYLEG